MNKNFENNESVMGKAYEAPQVEIIEVAVERGYQYSGEEDGTSINSLNEVNW